MDVNHKYEPCTKHSNAITLSEPPVGWLNSRVSVSEIARRLGIGRLAVYAMLEQGIMPGIRLGRRRIITRHACEQWERTCGMGAGAGLHARPEVTVLN
jgi:excisionase family DNA binding protein